jgi:ureidoglycolate lyase
MSIKIVAQPLTTGAFAPYGQVVEVSGRQGAAMNDGRAQRYLQNVRLQGSYSRSPELYLTDVSPSAGAVTLNYLERHPRSTQAFLPMRASRYLICVCLSDIRGTPQTETLTAFVAGATQGVNYAMGTWHYPIVALDTPALFSVLMWSEDGAGDFAGNCDLFKLADPLLVDWTS